MGLTKKGEEAAVGSVSGCKKPQPAKALWLGAISLQESLERQEELKDRLLFSQTRAAAGAVAERAPIGAGHADRGDNSSPAGFFMGFEPLSPVITMGVRAGEDDLLQPEGRLRERGLPVLRLKRGGRATVHAPGQALIYPVLPLRFYSLKVKDYIVRLEKCAQAALLSLGVKTRKREKDAGLFTSTGKIAFFGAHISKGISQHGAAFNVSNSLKLFSAVRSCGVPGRRHDSLHKRAVSLTPEEFFYVWTAQASEFFRQKGRAGLPKGSKAKNI